NGPNRLICLVRSVPNVEPAPPSCCRLATAKPCSSISTRSQPKSPSERTPLSSLIRPDGMALKPWWFRTTSHSCRCRRAHPNSTARKTSGSSCVTIRCQTAFSNPSTISSTTAATLGTHSSTNPGRLCPSRDATGQQSITQSEDWYKTWRGAWMVGRQFTRLSRVEEFGENLKGNVKAGMKVTALDLAAAEYTRQQLFHRFRELFERFDILLTRAAPVKPYPVEMNFPNEINGRKFDHYIDWIAPAFLITLVSLPAGSVPAGKTRDGLPVG